MEIDLKKHAPEEREFLEGQVLIAMPGLEDPRFARSVIYVCSHTGQGAMGLVVNRPAEHLNFPDLLVQLEVIPENEPLIMPERFERIEVMIGGPVESSRGFVLHSPDYSVTDTTMDLDEGISLTATVDILRAIARGSGPRDALLALGYAGWGPGQLETEIHANSWLTCPATTDLLFRSSSDLRYELALRSIGVDLGHLSTASGRA